MRNALISTSLTLALIGVPTLSHAVDYTKFSMVPSSSACLPSSSAIVTVSSRGDIQYMHLEVFGLPASHSFDVFILQVPKAPFGMAWYQGDVNVDSTGHGVIDFIGVFSKETFVVAPGVAPAPSVFPTDATSNPTTAPLQMYHIGIWFDSPASAAAAGCPSTTTPFNGTHNAGVQVLNTSNFTDNFGPLRPID